MKSKSLRNHESFWITYRIFFYKKYAVILFMFLTLISLSLISQEKIPGCCFFNCSILDSTSTVATLGFEPPMTPGLMLPVSWYLFNIFETQPWETRSCLEMTHGRIPAAAISTIFSRMWFGKGRPLMKTPPSWFTRPCPETIRNELH